MNKGKGRGNAKGKSVSGNLGHQLSDVATESGAAHAGQTERDAAVVPVLINTVGGKAFHERLFSTNILPEKARVDALHIAIAATHGITYLATWNCAHINNSAMRKKILEEIERAGYNKVVMATPEELWRLPR